MASNEIDIPQGLNEFAKKKVSPDENRVVVSQFLKEQFDKPGLYVLQHHNQDNIHTKNLYKIGSALNLRNRLGRYSGYIPEGIIVKGVLPIENKDWNTRKRLSDPQKRKRLDLASKLVKDELEYQGAEVLRSGSGNQNTTDWVRNVKNFKQIEDAVDDVVYQLHRKGNELLEKKVKFVARNKFKRATLVKNKRFVDRPRETKAERQKRITNRYNNTLENIQENYIRP